MLRYAFPVIVALIAGCASAPSAVSRPSINSQLHLRELSPAERFELSFQAAGVSKGKITTEGIGTEMLELKLHKSTNVELAGKFVQAGASSAGAAAATLAVAGFLGGGQLPETGFISLGEVEDHDEAVRVAFHILDDGMQSLRAKGYEVKCISFCSENDAVKDLKDFNFLTEKFVSKRAAWKIYGGGESGELHVNFSGAPQNVGGKILWSGWSIKFFDDAGRGYLSTKLGREALRAATDPEGKVTFAAAYGNAKYLVHFGKLYTWDSESETNFVRYEVLE